MSYPEYQEIIISWVRKTIYIGKSHFGQVNSVIHKYFLCVKTKMRMITDCNNIFKNDIF